MALRELGRFEDAERVLRTALDRDPRDAATHSALAFLWYSRGRPSQARMHWARAVELAPDGAGDWFHLGATQADLGDLDGALASFQRAQSLDPASDDALAGWAAVLERKGDVAEAAEIVRRSMGSAGEIKSANLALVYGRVARALGRSREAIEPLARLLDARLLDSGGGEGPTAREALHFLLGSLYEDVADVNSAFRHYELANGSRDSDFDPRRHQAMVQDLQRIYSRDRLAQYPRSKSPDRPIFIVGMPRSGTSLVERILAGHPEVAAGGEIDEVDRILNELPALLESPFPGYAGCLELVTSQVLDRLAARYLTRTRRVSVGPGRVIDKMPQNFYHLGFIALLFPGARILHCRRDAADTCFSYYCQHFVSGHDQSRDLRHLGLYYRTYVKLMAHWRRVLDLDILDLDYEALVRDPKHQARRMAKFCDLSWEDHYIDASAATMSTHTASYSQVRRPIYTASIGRSRRFRPQLGPLLEELEA
jgi:tetratricopeptide (TPR) repeat protein